MIATEPIFLLIELGTEITNMAAWVIVLSDLTLNFYLAAKIIWMKNKRNFDTKIKEAESMLVSILLNEFVDAVVPLTFCICLLLSYYGPNAELMCNIKSANFHCQPIKDIGRYVENLGFFFLVDMVGLMITGILLWSGARIKTISRY